MISLGGPRRGPGIRSIWTGSRDPQGRKACFDRQPACFLQDASGGGGHRASRNAVRCVGIVGLAGGVEVSHRSRRSSWSPPQPPRQSCRPGSCGRRGCAGAGCGLGPEQASRRHRARPAGTEPARAAGLPAQAVGGGSAPAERQPSRRQKDGRRLSHPCSPCHPPACVAKDRGAIGVCTDASHGFQRTRCQGHRHQYNGSLQRLTKKIKKNN